MEHLKKLEYYASKGIGIAVFEDKKSDYQWYSNIINAKNNESEIIYGYNSFLEALEEAFEIADWYLIDIGL